MRIRHIPIALAIALLAGASLAGCRREAAEERGFQLTGAITT